ncbi:MAG: hypothetical protein LBC20_14185 [Planctomycetaceae bacterium]|jgi:hypothetical protein|nr:hypothetical protein [Planctomycetaceae bacterium]
MLHFKKKLIVNLWVVLCVCCVLLISCQHINPDGREDVSGRITLNGTPIKATSANIIFDPLETDDKTAGGVGMISRDGTFLLTGANAVKSGKYRVRFSANISYDSTTQQPATSQTDIVNFYNVSLLPDELTTEKSMLTFEVIKGKKNIFNYDIVTNYKPNTKPTGRAARKGKPPL